MENITIRLATLNDFPAFYSFFEPSLNELFPQFTPLTQEFFLNTSHSRSSLRKDLKSKRYLLYIAFQEKRVVGMLLVTHVFGGVSFADWLAVDARYQKHGIAGRLLELWEKDVLKAGGHTIHLNTNKHNVPFYTHRGLTLIGVFPNAWFGLDYYHFYKNLAPAVEKNYLREYIIKKKTKSKS